MADYVLPKGVTTFAGVADTNNVIVGDGSQEVVTAIDQSALTEGLSGFRVGRGCTAKFGGSAGYMKFDLDSGAGVLDYNAGGGHLYYRPNGDNNLCNLAYQRGLGQLYIGEGGTVTELDASSSFTSINESTILTTLRMRGSADVKISYNATAITTAHLSGGTLTCARVMTTCNVYGKGVDKTTVVIRRENFSAASTPAPVTLNIRNASVRLEVAGTITLIDMCDGALDLSGTPGALTITDMNTDPESWQKSTMKSMFGATITHTNAVAFKFGPQM